MKYTNNIITEKIKMNSKTIAKSRSTIDYKFFPTNIYELKHIIKDLISERGVNADLNDIDTSKITDMNFLFFRSNFNGDISNWNVSNVKTMVSLFERSYFTGENSDLSNWDVSQVEDMSDMFKKCPLESNPPKWYKNN